MKPWQRRILTATLTAMLPALTWSINASERVTVDGVVAFVNQRGVTLGDVLAVASPAVSELSARYTGHALERRLDDVTQAARRRLIDRALILEDYERGDMRIPEPLIKSRIREITFDHFRGDHHQKLDALAQEGLTPATWREQLREEIIVSFMRDMYVSGRINLSPSDLRQAYRESLDRHMIPARVRLRVIMIRDADPDDPARRDLAASLVARLRDGARFEDLAASYSEGRHAGEGGDWGWINLEELRPELADVARELPENAFSEVITLNTDHYILEVTDRRQERVMPLAEVYEELERELRRRASERLHRLWIERLEARHAVMTLEDIF